jgi:hypothetical protein
MIHKQGDKVTWCEISIDPIHVEVNCWFFDGTIESVRGGICYCESVAGGARNVREDAIWSTRNLCREWAKNEVEKMKYEYAMAFAKALANLTPKGKI